MINYLFSLSENNIKSLEHLNHNVHLEHVDLSANQVKQDHIFHFSSQIQDLKIKWRSICVEVRDGV